MADAAPGGVSLDALLKRFSSLLAKAEGRDKLLATLQYAATIVAAGQAGKSLAVSKSLSSARKPFRFFKPVESLAPLLTGPAGPLTPLAVTAKVKSVAMALFFGLDHLVWAGSAGLVANAALLERAQTLSFAGWLLGSLCQLAAEGAELARLRRERDAAVAKAGAEGGAEAGRAAAAAAAPQLRVRTLALATAATQAALAAALLKLVPMSPRATGLVGLATSLLGLYQLVPPPELRNKAGKAGKAE